MIEAEASEVDEAIALEALPYGLTQMKSTFEEKSKEGYIHNLVKLMKSLKDLIKLREEYDKGLDTKLSSYHWKDLMNNIINNISHYPEMEAVIRRYNIEQCNLICLKKYKKELTEELTDNLFT